MNHIIVEGPDGSGKSTLIESLGLQRVHTVAFKPEYGTPVPFYSGRIHSANQPTGFDRLWLSEIIYGPILREKAALGYQEALLLKLMHPLVPVIVCLPPFELTYRMTRSRPYPDYQTDEFLIQSYAEFTRYADSPLVDYVYDWTAERGRRLRRSLGLPLDLIRKIQL